jgi:hypothetical protein
MPATQTDLATKIAAAIHSQGFRVYGARGTAGVISITLNSAEADAVHALVASKFGNIDGLVITIEKWNDERASKYAANVPSEAGASARLRLTA